MFRAIRVLSSLVAVLSVFGVSAESASPSIKFEWKVGGELLKEGEGREFTTTADGKNFDFHTTLAGSNMLFLSHEQQSGRERTKKGGKPGTGEEIIEFKGFTADPPLANCIVESDEASPTRGVVRFKPVKMGIVESEASKEPVILFTPKTGTVFVALLFLNKSSTETCPAGAAVLENLGGSFLGRPLPELAETLNGNIDFEAPDKNFILNSGALDKAGVTFAGNAFTFTGLELVILKADEVYGAF